MSGGLILLRVLQVNNSSNIEVRAFVDVRFKDKCDMGPALQTAGTA
jgi:hypothetical protein